MHGLGCEKWKRSRHMWPVPNSTATTVEAQSDSKSLDFFCKVYTYFIFPCLYLYLYLSLSGSVFIFLLISISVYAIGCGFRVPFTAWFVPMFWGGFDSQLVFLLCPGSNFRFCGL